MVTQRPWPLPSFHAKKDGEHRPLTSAGIDTYLPVATGARGVPTAPYAAPGPCCRPSPYWRRPGRERRPRVLCVTVLFGVVESVRVGDEGGRKEGRVRGLVWRPYTETDRPTEDVVDRHVGGRADQEAPALAEGGLQNQLHHRRRLACACCVCDEDTGGGSMNQ